MAAPHTRRLSSYILDRELIGVQAAPDRLTVGVLQWPVELRLSDGAAVVNHRACLIEDFQPHLRDGSLRDEARLFLLNDDQDVLRECVLDLSITLLILALAGQRHRRAEQRAEQSDDEAFADIHIL